MKFIERAKRRRAGIYLVRTRKHRGRRRENGYVGRSKNVPIRVKQHLGQDARHKPKPWTDLKPRWHVLWLPWWLSWKWVQAPLEAIAIRLLLPRYNVQLNKGNPRRVTLAEQARQRAARDRKLSVVQEGIERTRLYIEPGLVGYKVAGVALMLAAVALPILAAMVR